MKNIMDKGLEILQICLDLGIIAHRISESESQTIIQSILKKFEVQKTIGHLAIYSNTSVAIPLENNEFIYSLQIPNKPIYLFFEQGQFHKNILILITEGSRICEIMKNSYTSEYFVSNIEQSFIIAVNWYVIEGDGEASDWLTTLFDT